MMTTHLRLAGLIGLTTCFAWGAVPGPAATPAAIPGDSGRRLEVLFLGSENKFEHDPIARFRVIRKALGPRGINFTYAQSLEALTPPNLAKFDVLLLFANHETIAPEQLQALLKFAKSGGGCVFLHCAAGCFRQSKADEYVQLLGAQFKSHETGVFRSRIVAPEHPVMKGWEGFECWDETYLHQRHGDDRTILQERDGEPWTWVKNFGDGRVFYTASGHDHRCWNLPQYHDLLLRAIRWTAGDAKAAMLGDLALPTLTYRLAAVPKDPDNPVGPLNEIQLPLAPAESLKLAQIPPGFELRVFASEPMIVNPIAINWDHRGRLWVVEAFDYPHKIGTENPQDRIKILEDTDHDGVADKVTIFAEGLNICTSVLPFGEGAIATDGPDMIHLLDTDRDDKADQRRVLWTGIGLRDTHACTSNLRYGFDGWIYATVGYSGLDVTVAGRRHQTAQAVFRFKSDASDFEILQNTSNNTWGISFTEEGDLVGSTANGNPSWYLTIPNRSFELVGRDPQQVARADRQEPLYPITTDYFQNNPKEQCSSGAGHAIYTARRFPQEWWNRRAFICEPPMHLVAAPRHENVGDTFQTTHFENNLYASADAWSAPVAAEVGPDGAVWIADWYNPICNHNPFRPHQKLGPGNAHLNDDRDREHGRIYRVFPAGSRDDAYPDLRTAEECLAALKHPNLFWRLAAQQTLLVLLDQPANDPLLRAKAAVAFPAGSALSGINPNPLDSPAASREVRTSQEFFADLFVPPAESELKGLQDPTLHPLTRKYLALQLVEKPPHPTLGESLARLLLTDSSLQHHHHLADAVRLAVLKHPEGFVRHLLENNLDPDQPALKRTVADLLTRFESDRSILSDGLLAFARNSGSPIAARLTAAAGAAPFRKPAANLSESAQRGERVYFACVACHQPDGKGLPGAFPALAGSERATGDPARAIKIILKGLQGPLHAQGRNFDGGMPGHESFLNDQQIADVLNYVRSSWGNQAPGIDPAAVATLRTATREQQEPWTIGQLE